ncbi:hypothetical protein L873DRAFT_1822359 [Choiromyces venosus 120613-1]|uniref:Uncharacterized protein n=1 Tax=Choiromyces venosus 120613-1 TaxID=1336337 RepID=A0A3N4IV27_9PEZI|nr:hypothetical protein L873DRAFT_1822359 [Choiromyces venosus 120613-1]
MSFARRLYNSAYAPAMVASFLVLCEVPWGTIQSCNAGKDIARIEKEAAPWGTTQSCDEGKKDIARIEKKVDLINMRVNMVLDGMLAVTQEVIGTTEARNDKGVPALAARLGYCKLCGGECC